MDGDFPVEQHEVSLKDLTAFGNSLYLPEENNLTEMIVFILLLLVRFATPSKYSTGHLIYLDFLSPTASVLPAANRSRTVLSAIHSDDSPFSRVKLPWAFNFFGIKIYNVFVSPNGAIHQTYDQPCACSCYGDSTCNFQKGYTGLIAGYLADLNPSQALKTANITSYITANVVTIRFEKVPIINRPASIISFRISLFKDSHVVIDYDSIIKDQVYSSWITGLRPAFGNAHTKYTAAQNSSGVIRWKTTYPGLYPDKSQLFTGMQYTTCPMAAVWGVLPE